MREMREAGASEGGMFGGTEMETFSSLFDEEIAGLAAVRGHAMEVAGGTEPRGAVGSGEVLRVGLDRHLLQCRCVEVVVGGLDHVRQGVGREERRSPPAQVQGAQRGRGTVFLAHSLRLGAQRADVAALVAAGRGEVEVAVDAALRAERDVDVEASQGERVF